MADGMDGGGILLGSWKRGWVETSNAWLKVMSMLLFIPLVHSCRLDGVLPACVSGLKPRKIQARSLAPAAELDGDYVSKEGASGLVDVVTDRRYSGGRLLASAGYDARWWGDGLNAEASMPLRRRRALFVC